MVVGLSFTVLSETVGLIDDASFGADFTRVIAVATTSKYCSCGDKVDCLRQRSPARECATGNRG